jgi:hypothetical protein
MMTPAIRDAAIRAALAMNLHGGRPPGFHGPRTLLPRAGPDEEARAAARARRAEKLRRRRAKWLASGGRD